MANGVKCIKYRFVYETSSEMKSKSMQQPTTPLPHIIPMSCFIVSPFWNRGSKHIEKRGGEEIKIKKTKRDYK